MLNILSLDLLPTSLLCARGDPDLLVLLKTSFSLNDLAN